MSDNATDWQSRIDRAAELHRDALLISDHADNLLAIAHEYIDEILNIIDQPIEHNTDSDRCPSCRARTLCDRLDSILTLVDNLNFELSDSVDEQHFLIEHLTDQ